MDEPVVTNERGGKQSDIGKRFDLLPHRAVAAIAGVLDIGAKKYGDDNWRLIGVASHLNHALGHINAYLGGQATDEELAHAATRLLFALEVHLDGDNGPEMAEMRSFAGGAKAVVGAGRVPADISISRSGRPIYGPWRRPTY